MTYWTTCWIRSSIISSKRAHVDDRTLRSCLMKMWLYEKWKDWRQKHHFVKSDRTKAFLARQRNWPQDECPWQPVHNWKLWSRNWMIRWSTVDTLKNVRFYCSISRCVCIRPYILMIALMTFRLTADTSESELFCTQLLISSFCDARMTWRACGHCVALYTLQRLKALWRACRAWAHSLMGQESYHWAIAAALSGNNDIVEL